MTTFSHMEPSQQKEIKRHQMHIPKTDNQDEMTSQHIRRILTKTDGKIHGLDGAAERLGINANTRRNRMNKLGVEYG